MRTSGNGALETTPSVVARARMLGNKCIASRVILGQVHRVLVVKLTGHDEDAVQLGYDSAVCW